MNIDLTKLIYSNLYQIPIKEELKVPEELLINTDIKKLSPISVEGNISYVEEEYSLNIDISGTMTLTCARTLKDVLYPFSTHIEEVIGENSENSIQIIQNRVDIFPIIWQYILLDVPLKVLHPDAKEKSIEGDGWRLITEDDKKEVIDPRLADLSKFIKE